MIYYIANIIVFFLIDIFLYRTLKINFFIECIKFSLTLFFIFQLVLYINNKIDITTQILIIFNYLFFLCFYYFVFMGVKKVSPTLYIIYLIKKKNSINQIRNLFLKKLFFPSRITENIEFNLVVKKKNYLQITKKGTFIMNFIKVLTKLLKI